MAKSQTDLSKLSPGAKALAQIDELVFKFESFFNLASGMIILALMMLAVVQVVGRKVFNFPVRGYVDWVEAAMAFFAFLSIAYTQKLGGHIRMELFIQKFHGRMLWIVEVIGTLVSLFIISILIFYAYNHFLRAWTIGDSSMDIELPIWPGKLLVAFAFGTLILRLLIQLTGFIRLSIHPEAQPIGIPIIESVEQHAQHEIDAGLAGEEEKINIVDGGGLRP